jgi:hypothetical protein
LATGDKHLLKVDFRSDPITFEANFTSLHASYESTGIGSSRTAHWFPKDSTPKLTRIDLKPHVLVIHRTKLKELVTNCGPEIIAKITAEIPTVIVTTGSGTTHGLDGEFKILPFSTLNELLLGKRIQKLRFSKLLLELTKNKI